MKFNKIVFKNNLALIFAYSFLLLSHGINYGYCSSSDFLDDLSSGSSWSHSSNNSSPKQVKGFTASEPEAMLLPPRAVLINTSYCISDTDNSSSWSALLQKARDVLSKTSDGSDGDNSLPNIITENNAMMHQSSGTDITHDSAQELEKFIQQILEAIEHKDSQALDSLFTVTYGLSQPPTFFIAFVVEEAAKRALIAKNYSLLSWLSQLNHAVRPQRNLMERWLDQALETPNTNMLEWLIDPEKNGVSFITLAMLDNALVKVRKANFSSTIKKSLRDILQKARHRYMVNDHLVPAALSRTEFLTHILESGPDNSTTVEVQLPSKYGKLITWRMDLPTYEKATSFNWHEDTLSQSQDNVMPFMVHKQGRHLKIGYRFPDLVNGNDIMETPSIYMYRDLQPSRKRAVSKPILVQRFKAPRKKQ